MSARKADEESVSGGFATVDEKGRISLPKQIRRALGVRAGSSVAYVLLDHTLLIIPQDEHLATLSKHASDTLAAAELTVDDLLAELPAAREEVVREMYGEEFMAELERMRHDMQASEAQSQGKQTNGQPAQEPGI